MSLEKKLYLPREIQTNRLSIQAPKSSSGIMLNEAIKESFLELSIWMSWARAVPTEEESSQVCADAENDFKKQKDFPFHIFLKESNQFVGSSGLHRFDLSVPRFEIGYWIRSSLVGNGYATESVMALSYVALTTLKANRVEIHCSSKNVSSQQVAERSGYKLEASLKNHRRENDGNLQDTKIYTVTTIQQLPTKQSLRFFD